MTSPFLLLTAGFCLLSTVISPAAEPASSIPENVSNTGNQSTPPRQGHSTFSLPSGEEAAPLSYFKLNEVGDEAQLRKPPLKNAREAVGRLHASMTRKLSDATRKRLEDIWNAGDNATRSRLLDEWMKEQITCGSTDAASALSIEALHVWCGACSRTARELFFDHLRRAFSSPAPVRSTHISRWLYYTGACTNAPADAIYPLMDAINGITRMEIETGDFFSFYPYSNWQTQAWRLWNSPQEYAPAVRTSKGTWGISNLGFLLHDMDALITSNTRQGLRHWHSSYGSGNLPDAVKTAMRAMKKRHMGTLPEPFIAEQIRQQASGLPVELLGFVPRCTLAVLPDAMPWKPLDDPEASVFMMPDTSAVFLPQWNDGLLGKKSSFPEDLRELDTLAAEARDNKTLQPLMAFSLKESEQALPNNYRRSWLGVEGYDTFYSGVELSSRRDGIDIVITPKGPQFSRNDPVLRRMSRTLSIALHKCMLKTALLEKTGNRRNLEAACGQLAAILNKYGLWPLLCSQYEMRGVSPEAFVLLVSQFRGKPELLAALSHVAGMPPTGKLSRTTGGVQNAAALSSLMREFMVLTGAIHAPENERRKTAEAWLRLARDMESPEAAQIICLNGMTNILAAWEDIPASFISGRFSYTGYHLVREALDRGNRKRAETLFSRMTERPDGYFHAPARLALALLNRNKGNLHAAERNEQDALILAVIHTQHDIFSGYVQRKAVMEHGLLRETEKLLFLIPGSPDAALLRELTRAYARERRFESAAFLAEYLLHQECMKSTPAWGESSQRAIVEWRLQADAFRALSLLRQGKKEEGERLLSRAFASLPSARPQLAAMLGALVGTCRDVREQDKKAWAQHAPDCGEKNVSVASVNDLFKLHEKSADPYLKFSSKWYEWHLMQGNTVIRKERSKIVSADYDRMKGKWLRLLNEAGREYRIRLDNLAPDDIDHIMDWKKSNGIRTWEYVSPSGYMELSIPPFDGMLVDKRVQDTSVNGSSVTPVIRKTNGSITIMPAGFLDTESRQYVDNWKEPYPENGNETQLNTFPSWRQAIARAECACMDAVAFILGKRGGPEEAEFKRKILDNPEEVKRLNRTSAVVVCYQDGDGQWDACGREVFLQLHFSLGAVDQNGHIPPEHVYSSGFVWIRRNGYSSIASQFRPARDPGEKEKQLRQAMEKHRPEQVRELLAKDRTLAAAIFPDTQWSAIYTAIDASTPEIVRLLIDSGASVNSITPNGAPMLQAASIREKTDMVRLLLERGADPNAPYKTGPKSERYALGNCRGNAEIMKLLLDAGATFDKNPDLAFDTLASVRTPEALQLLTQYGITLKARNVNGDTPLKHAIDGNNAEQVRLYLEHGADPNETDRYGFVPLFNAIAPRRNPEIVRLLIKHGANVNILDKSGISMLDRARKRECPAIEQLLLKHGAKTTKELKRNQPINPSSNTPERTAT